MYHSKHFRGRRRPDLSVAPTVIPGDVGASICAACGDAGPGNPLSLDPEIQTFS